MNPIGRIAANIGHLIAALAFAVLDFGDSPWLRRKLEQEDAQVGRLI